MGSFNIIPLVNIAVQQITTEINEIRHEAAEVNTYMEKKFQQENKIKTEKVTPRGPPTKSDKLINAFSSTINAKSFQKDTQDPKHSEKTALLDLIHDLAKRLKRLEKEINKKQNELKKEWNKEDRSLGLKQNLEGGEPALENLIKEWETLRTQITQMEGSIPDDNERLPIFKAKEIQTLEDNLNKVTISFEKFKNMISQTKKNIGGKEEL